MSKCLLLGTLLLALAPQVAGARHDRQPETSSADVHRESAPLSAQPQRESGPSSGPVEVSAPAVPTITPAVRDLPDWKPDPSLFGLEMKRREDFGFVPTLYPITPRVDPLLGTQPLTQGCCPPDGFATPVHNYAGQSTFLSPPDDTGDVGPDHFLQAVNQFVSAIEVMDKHTGANLKTFTMQSLTTATPCKHGFCDPIVLYDRMADRWLISELPRSGPNVCVYVSTSNDPTGTWYAYTFAVEPSGITDYPKYGVWPQNGGGGSYLVGVNAGSGTSKDLFALDRARMLAGQPATFQKFSVPALANSGFQLVLPSTMQGSTPPPEGEPAIFMRPHDDEAEDGLTSPAYDLMDMWTLSVDWATPANSRLTQLPSLQIGDYDMTLCGLGDNWNCMPQPGTIQRLDPIREPLHFPLQYRNFGDHQTLVGTFVEDVDGTDHAALRWFEIRKTGAGAWGLYQEGVVGGEPGVHRSVGSIGMDGAGNIAIGYTRTAGAAPYYPSIYYKGRLSTDALGTLPQGEYAIQDATTSKTNNERWGDYSGMAVDPVDDCTFWFTTEYGGAGDTRVAAFKFDECGCLAQPAAPSASASTPQGNRIDVAWNDSGTASISQYLVYRSTTSGGPYAQIAAVPDSSPGVANGSPYVYHDEPVSGGTRYYYLVRSTDGASCTSPSSVEVSAVATGQCLLVPSFAGVASVSNAHNSTCTLNLSWDAGTSACSGTVTYNVYRSTTLGFVPAPANRVAAGLPGTTYTDGVGISNATTYYYIVRAVDSANGFEETNSARQSGAPTGPLVTSSWTDTFEGSSSGGGFDRAGWSHSPINGTLDWALSTTQLHDGSHSWWARGSNTTSDKVLVCPPFGVGSTTTLSFYHTYSFVNYFCSDAATLEYTTNGGATWTVVPIADFTAGGFNGTAGSGSIIAGKRAWCGGTIGPMTQVAVNLGGDANLLNRTVQLRWHEGDVGGQGSTGWYVDSVTVNNLSSTENCATAPFTVSSNGPICESATLQLTASYPQGGVSYSWTGPNGFTSGAQNPSVPNAAESAAGVYEVTVTWGGATLASGSTDVTVVRDGAACSDGDGCTRTDVCQSGTCVGSNPVVCTASDQCHVAGLCDPASGVCSNPAVGNGTACDDGDLCTVSDACQAGACVGAPVPPPAGTTGLVLGGSGELTWTPVAGASGYDVVRGTISTLLGGGSFTPATDACVANNLSSTSLSEGHVPSPGNADWYLVRARNACGGGTYTDGSPSQASGCDTGIAGSPNACH